MAVVNSISPLISVARIEPCLSFWTDRLGFELVATVPEDPKAPEDTDQPLGFAMLTSGDTTVMLQSGGSLDWDLPGISAEVVPATTMLFMKVDDLEDFLPRLVGLEVIHEHRTTFYDMDEIFVRSPCGTIVGLAAPVDAG